MIRRRLVAALLSCALAAPGAALADPTEKARSHYKQGKAYQEAGAYDKAIAEYLEADRIAPRPALLFNIAQCHRLAGHAEEAVVFYRRFVEAMPDAPAADESRMYIAQLEQQVAAERKRREEAAKKQQAQAAPAPAAPALVPDTSVAAGPSDRDDSRASWRWLGIGGAVGGVAAIGVGAYLGVRAADESAALASHAGEWSPDLESREEAAQADERSMWILVGAGSAFVLGGAALWWWAGSTRVEAAPSVGSDRAGVVVRGRF